MIRAWQIAQGQTKAATGFLTQSQADELQTACRVAVSPLCAGQTGKSCWMELSNRPGCYTWNPNPVPEETVTWSGSCRDGKVSGRGKVTWRYRKDGAWRTASNEGEYRDGKGQDGHWVYYSADGGVDEGPRVNGKNHGLWVKRGSGRRAWVCFSNGERYGESACVSDVDRTMQAKTRTQLRIGPDASFSESGVLQAEEKVRVTAEAGEWMWVGTEDGREGFVRASALKEGPAFRVGHVFRDCLECPEMVVIPGGSYMMGSPSGEEGRSNNEGPRHEVTIPRPFAVGKYEVTFAEWDVCVAGGGCGGYRPIDRGWGRGRRPVIEVSWEDTKSYVEWLSRKTGKRYRLLTESEWEYVARAGTTGPFHFGRTISTELANYEGDGLWRSKTVSVGSFPANGFGLHDVHGNVWEWGGGLLARGLYRGTGGRECLDVQRRLLGPRVARRRFLEQRTEVPPVRLPRQELAREPVRQRRVPYCPNAHPVNLYLFTSFGGSRGRSPLVDFHGGSGSRPATLRRHCKRRSATGRRRPAPRLEA